jgi:hypothetical protein
MVILVTPTALKVDDIGPWVHHSHVHQASQQKQEEANPLKLKFIRPRRHTEQLSM